MAIVRTKPFFAIGSNDCKERFFCELQKYGCVELKQGNVNSCYFDEIAFLSDRVTKVDRAMLGLKKFCGIKKAIFKFKKIASLSVLEKVDLQSESLFKKVERVNWCCKIIEGNLVRISELEQSRREIFPYLKFDFCLSDFESKFTKGFVGCCVGRLSEQKLKKMFDDDVYFEIIDNSKVQTVLFFIVLKSGIEKAKKVFKNLKFSVVESVLDSGMTVCQQLSLFDSEIEKLKLQNVELKKELEQYRDSLVDFELLFDYFKLKLERKNKLSSLISKKSVFFLDGYLDPRFEMEFKKLAKFFGIYYEIEEIKNSGGSSPVDFENGSFVSAVEDVTETYSMPSEFDVDPNPVMAFFYYLFFGIMFSDAGYGAIMAIFCSIFVFFKKVDLKTKKKFRMFFWCGVSTMFWGLMFGSFFGDFVGTASRVFFGLNFSLPPIFLDSLTEPMKLLGFSLFLGLIQVFVGVFVSFIAMLKFRKFKEAFFVKFGWLLFLFGAGFFSFVVVMEKSELVRSRWFIMALNFGLLRFFSLIFVLIGVVFILFLSGYKNKGIFKRFLSGVINLYGVTSYVGDVLSYCRLMALSIATGVVANVVNLLSTMMCVNFFGFCAFFAVFIFGHLMNFGINALGAYVHTIRLQYVEFFSKFYEGGGRMFFPYGLGVTEYFEFEVESTVVK